MQKAAPLKIVKASAGSGKTFSLTVHYLALLFSKESNYREILAVTFTNKATSEMKERILEVLEGLAKGDESRKINDYRLKIMEAFPQWDSHTIQEKAHRIYRRILHDYSHFSVSTIDGFSQKVIRSFTYELNLDSAYAIEMNTNKVKHDLTVMLNQLLDEKPELLEWIIEYAEQKIGKNENWNYRNQLLSLAGLIFSEHFQEFDSNLLTADSDKIFKLLNKEIEEKSKEFIEALGLAIDHFKSSFKALGIDESELKGKSKNRLISLSKAELNVKKLSITDIKDKVFNKFDELLSKDDTFIDQNKENREDILLAILPSLEIIKSLESHFSQYIAYQAVYSNLYYLRLLKEMSNLLGQWRKDNSAQLISDSQILLNKLGIDEKEDPTFIWEKIGNRYNYFLFDEFQDTSRIQWKNYSPLLINALGNSSGNFNEHLIVGDVKQSIYRWRNGDWRILLQQVEQQVTQSFHLNEESKAEMLNIDSLDSNYRSLANIIKFNNYLFSKIPQQLQSILNEKVSEELNEEGKIWWKESGNDLMLINAYANSNQEIPQHLLDPSLAQGNIEINYFPVENSQWRRNKVIDISVQELCAKIEEWLSTGKYEPSQIGILVRSNAQGKFLIQELMNFRNERELDFEVISGDALLLSSNNAIQLLIETLKALVYQSEQYVVLHANMAYLYQIILGNSNFDKSYWLKFKQNNIQIALKGILPDSLLDSWVQLQKMPIVHLIEKLIEIYDLGLASSIHLPYLLSFKDMISRFASKGDKGIIQFLEYWEEDGLNAYLPSNGKVNAIEISSIHKSKGLAYDVVMIPFCSWSLDGMTNSDFWINVENSPFEALGKIPIKYNKPLGKSIFYKQYFEEMLFNYMDALNTLYVANTRAIKHLYISAPGFKQNVDKKNPDISSPDIKSEYISDIMLQILDVPNIPYSLVDNKLQIDGGENLIKEDKKSKDINPIFLSKYPFSKELEEALEESNERSINTIMLMEKAAQYGIMAHDILSKIEVEEDIKHLVDQYLEEGIFPIDEKDLLMKEINAIWNHPLINKWLTSNYRIWNEASIITKEGKTKRPDRVFSNDEETIVLDFKFTSGDYIDHKYQVNLYMDALKNIGYQQVKGYLYYAKSGELVEVK